MKSIKPDGRLPLLPLRDMVVFPRSVAKIYVGRPASVHAVHKAIEEDNLMLVCTQKKADLNEPTRQDLYEMGAIGKILRLQGLPDGTARLVIQGTDRFTLCELFAEKDYLEGSYRLIDSPPVDKSQLKELFKLLLLRSREYAQLRQHKDNLLDAINNLATEPYNLFDFAANMLPLSLEEKYKLLACKDAVEMVALLIGHLDGHLELHKIDERLQERVIGQINRNQREYYLNEQMKALQKEMGELDGGKSGDPNDALAERIERASMSEEAGKKARDELAKLRHMPPMSSESAVIRNYLDVLLNLPWKKKTRPNYNLEHARRVLDRDHYGLKDVKERIVEYIAAYKRGKDKVKTPILCLVGPPGVGKTSLAKSIADAVNRKFVRMALGGVRDESEIRGHRRTYIGAMPGRIVQKLTKSEVVNPVFLFDEIDKMGMDFRGDPASALLEVLDPEQNSKFNDHYLEVDYDLSRVMFICTSNSMNIPEPLLDRLEIIRLAGYTENEKQHIARRHLIAAQLAAHSCTKDEVRIDDEALASIINHYTREAGVRSLEREIAKVIRKSLLKLEQGAQQKGKKTKPESLHITTNALDEYLGPKKFEDSELAEEDKTGVVNGLAWTRYGGHILKVETAVFPGKGECIITGSVGDVMRESVRAALSVLRARSHWLKLPDNFFNKHDFHVHIPEGATPKDGPSAGITLCTALFSLMSGRMVAPNMAMTGELTISGSVLPIGGLKEKMLAAHRAGIRKVFIPRKNAKDLVEIPSEVLDAMQVVEIGDIDQLLSQAIERFDPAWLTLPQPFLFGPDKERPRDARTH